EPQSRWQLESQDRSFLGFDRGIDLHSLVAAFDQDLHPRLGRVEIELRPARAGFVTDLEASTYPATRHLAGIERRTVLELDSPQPMLTPADHRSGLTSHASLDERAVRGVDQDHARAAANPDRLPGPGPGRRKNQKYDQDPRRLVIEPLLIEPVSGTRPGLVSTA